MEIFQIKDGCYFGSSYFYFSDTNLDGIFGEKSRCHEGFSIEEDYVWGYLITFINKYADRNFEYGDEKCFSKEIVGSICSDILEVCNVIKSNFNDPSLDEFKKAISIFYFASNEELEKYDLRNKPNDEINKFIESRKERILDFYNHFIERITLLVDSSKEKKIYIHTP